MKIINPTLSLLIALTALVVSAAPAHAAEVWWLGGDGDWNDPTKWSGGEIPDVGDTVWLGYADGGNVSNAAQTITLAGDVVIDRLRIFGNDDRAVTLNGGTLMFGAPNSGNAIVIDATASQPTTFNSNLAINRRAQVNVNNSLDLIINGNVQPTPPLIPGTEDPFPNYSSSSWSWRIAGAGNAPVVFEGSASQSIGHLEVVAPGQAIVADNAAISFTRLAANQNISSRFEQNAAVSAITVDAGRTMSLIRAESGDVAVGSRSMDIMGGATGILQIAAGSEEQGHFTLIAGRMGNGESNSTGLGPGAALVLSADSTVEFQTTTTSTHRRGIFAADNERISGAGNLRMNMNNAADVLHVYGVLTYTGRTMLESGEFQLRVAGTGEESWQIGQLPQGTIAEIGSSAKLNLNGIDQQLGGISNYNDTAGEVLLGGAVMTIHSQANSAFSGTISGTGAIVKQGEATFTINGNYTNPVGRDLIVADGLFAVSNQLSLVDGTFALTGGRITADTLVATNVTWAVILAATAADLHMVAVTNADITAAILAIELDLDYTPLIGTQFTLLYASESITGANSSNMFGYTDGAELTISGVNFVINWVEGSEAIVLTVIPEPAHVAILFGLATLLIVRHRRR